MARSGTYAAWPVLPTTVEQLTDTDDTVSTPTTPS